MCEQIMLQIEGLDYDEDVKCFRLILNLVTLPYRSLSILELNQMADFSEDYCSLRKAKIELSEFCTPFLIIRKGMIYFAHQSAKDFFTKGVCKKYE